MALQLQWLQRLLLLTAALALLTPIARRGQACFSKQRQTAKVDENPMSEWSQWDECDLPCGDGKQTRYRATVLISKGKEIQTRPCGVSCAENFDWSDWSDWSNCSQTCGSQGVRSRNRKCKRKSDGFVEAQRIACLGDWMEVEPCNQIECSPVYTWGQWSNWTPCTQTCGAGGLHDRSRKCQTDKLESADALNCGGVFNETRACNEEVPCPKLPDWQPWTEWSSCSITCGSATVTRSRERRCDPDQPPGLCIRPDVAMETEKRDCGLPTCPVINGGWGPWNPWSNCLATCGWGYRVRNRICNNPAPLNGGLDCSSTSAGYERCLGGECPVDGQWGAWAPCIRGGSLCATNPRDTCKPGSATFCRQCDNPKPEFNGTPCATGMASEKRDCWNTDACDNSLVQPPMNFTVIGHLDSSDLLVTWIRAPYGLLASSFVIAWSVSGTDTSGDAEVPVVPLADRKTLGESYSYWLRNLIQRSVVEVSVSTRSTLGGLLRVSEPVRQSFQVSRVDGGWGEWGSYSSCSPTADCNIPGTHQRSRVCNNPAPTNGGLDCPGSQIETSRCFHPC